MFKSLNVPKQKREKTITLTMIDDWYKVYTVEKYGSTETVKLKYPASYKVLTFFQGGDNQRTCIKVTNPDGLKVETVYGRILHLSQKPVKTFAKHPKGSFEKFTRQWCRTAKVGG